jgi:hypothetical protein
VLGCGGSGKAVLANRLGTMLGIPVTHLVQAHSQAWMSGVRRPKRVRMAQTWSPPERRATSTTPLADHTLARGWRHALTLAHHSGPSRAFTPPRVDARPYRTDSMSARSRVTRAGISATMTCS